MFFGSSRSWTPSTRPDARAWKRNARLAARASHRCALAGDVRVVAGGFHAEHLRRQAPVRRLAQRLFRVAAEDAHRELGLRVERPADADHVGFAAVEDPHGFGVRSYPADGE